MIVTAYRYNCTHIQNMVHVVGIVLNVCDILFPYPERCSDGSMMFHVARDWNDMRQTLKSHPRLGGLRLYSVLWLEEVMEGDRVAHRRSLLCLHTPADLVFQTCPSLFGAYSRHLNAGLLSFSLIAYQSDVHGLLHGT